jgi:hypothetical protein
VFGIVVSVNKGSSSAAPFSASALPPATFAGQDFTPYLAASTRGITQLQGRVASSGDEVVAVGAETGQPVPRTQFFVSLNDGRSWTLGTVAAADGGAPAPGHTARFVAGGHGKWAAIGPYSVWTSANGQAWTLASAGLPMRPGDQIAVLKRTSEGFIAAGANIPGGNQARATPVVFLSADGRHWTRLGAGELRLAAGSGRAADIRLAAALGNRILIAGDVVSGGTSRSSGHLTPTRTGGAWLSDDGGRSWTPVRVPGGYGAQPEFTDAVAITEGFLLVRPAVADGVPGADVYISQDGTAWRFAAALTGPAGFTPSLMNSGPDGAVLTGAAGRTLTAFVSHDGIGWWQTTSIGDAAAQSVSGVAVTNTGAVLAAGMSAAVPGSSQQLITVDGRTGRIRNVTLAAIPGAVEPQLAVNALAAQDGTQVAVGGANGFPAAWVSVNHGGTWRRATGQTGAVLDGRGIQQLTGVTHGDAGWLAVGGVSRDADPPHPLVLVSADGGTWSAVDGSRAFSGAGLVTRQAASDGGIYVIVGDQAGAASASGGGSGRSVAAAWWSDGLKDWHRADDAMAMDGGGNSQMLAVAATIGGSGFTAAGAHGAHPAIWTSRHGSDWSRTDLPLPAGATTAVLQHIVANGHTVVATGIAQTAARQVPFAAQSRDDGMTWQESVLPSPAGATQATTITAVTALTAAGSGFAATGTFTVSPGHQDVVIWTSADGMHWTATTPAGRGFAGPGIQAITSLDASGDLVTGVGFAATPAGEQPTLWLARIH